MNTLLLTLMLLSPNQATIDNEVKLQTAHAVNVIQLENQAHLKKQITLTLEKMEMTLPIIIDKQTLAKNQTLPKQLSED
ncbi:hypothetical protein [Pseudoalteromonas sp.]|uniref:hypothetical protein n=1 Tax=Pseudoalteromonas sp. TaxID=53249 RepID=UPI0030024659